MTVETVAADESVLASTVNKLGQHVNGSPGRAVFTSNGVWSVPAGAHKFKVYLAGGGGGTGADYTSGGESPIFYPGSPGGVAPLCSKLFAGQAIGTSFSITIGAAGAAPSPLTGGNGGTSTFGALLSSSGGTGGNDGSGGGARAAAGSHNGEMVHDNDMFLTGAKYVGKGYGAEDTAGICVIEW